MEIKEKRTSHFISFNTILLVLICLVSICVNSCAVIYPKKHKKPVIYLYPQQQQEVSVKIDLKGSFTFTEPLYENGWNVIAEPDGKIFNPSDGKNYPYLFWEADIVADYKLDEGFVVEGNKTKTFLDSILPVLGLNENEKAEFISFWNPIMEKNKFNKIRFAGEDYTSNAKLNIVPKPDVITRVFMVFKKCESFEIIPRQKISEPKKREGFTVIEWGGVNLDENTEEDL
ncbi:MAG: hypothetical protein IAF38_06615 [Bacteroidia bacterium]|nr:hypothetical protein [Bacteroidia bacterium]